MTKFRSKKYQTLHKRKTGSGSAVPEDKKLLEMARAMFSRMKSKKPVKDFVAKRSDRVIRFDLMGTPEVSFLILINNGKLEFSSKRMPADLAFGIPKNLFVKLIDGEATIGNLKFILNNISFRAGTVRECLRLKSVLLGAVFGGDFDKKQKNWRGIK